MMTREDAKRDAEKIWRTEETDVTRYTEEPPAWSGAYEARAARPALLQDEFYNDYTDNPHGPVRRRVGEPDSRWLCANGHGPFDPPRVRVDGVPVTSLTPTFDPEVQAYIDDANVRRQIANIGKDNDPVNHPSHYSDAGGHEPIKVIEAWDLGFHLGNTVKYISRAGKKDPNKRIEDLKKAAWYLARHIENLENDR